jgi:hypothetical protein
LVKSKVLIGIYRQPAWIAEELPRLVEASGLEGVATMPSQWEAHRQQVAFVVDLAPPEMRIVLGVGWRA